MENVKGLVSKKFKPLFDKWLAELQSYGYQTYYKVMNAKDYGVPQNRERVFVVGILSDDYVSYQFPRPFRLEKRLKDLLEPEVDDKYILPDKSIEDFVKHNEQKLLEWIRKSSQ